MRKCVRKQKIIKEKISKTKKKLKNAEKGKF